MTIATTASSVRVQGNGAQTVFNYGFLVPPLSAFALYLVAADGTITLLDPSVYAVSGIGNASGGTFTYPISGTPVAAGNWLVFVRLVPAQQDTSLSNQGPYLPAVVEAAMDWLEMQIQQTVNAMTQTVRAPLADVAMLPLPMAAQRASGYLTFDSNGQPTITAATVPSGTISTAMLPVVEAATLDAGRVAFGAGALGDAIFQAVTAATARTTLGVQPRGVVSMQRVAGVWTVFMPDGSILNTSASTTQGLQEAIDAACTPANTAGYDLEVLGGSNSTYGAASITCSTAITIPATQGKHLLFSSVSIEFTSAVTGPRFIVDSQEMSRIATPGCQVVSNGSDTGPLVLIQPKNGTPGDNNIAITNSHISLDTLAVAGTSSGPSSVVEFDMTYGSIGASVFEFIEINGAGASNSAPASVNGVTVTSPPAGNVFSGNLVRIALVHEVSETGIAIGGSAVNAANLRNNIWDIGGVVVAGASTTTKGISTWGTGDQIRIADVEFGSGTGSLWHYVSLESSSANNDVRVGGIFNGASASYNDGGANNRLFLGATEINNKNIAAVGHHRLPDGTWENWGYVDIAGSSSAAVTFDKEFPNGVLNIQLSTNNGPSVGLASPSWNGPSATGVTIYNNNGGSMRIYYRALGY